MTQEELKELEDSRIAASLKSLGYTKGNILAYCYYGGPSIKREHILEAKKAILTIHADYTNNCMSTYYIDNTKKRIQREMDLINDFFIKAGYDEFRLIGIPLPLYIHHVINIINGCDQEIAKTFFDRIQEESASKQMSYSELNCKIKKLFGED